MSTSEIIDAAEDSVDAVQTLSDFVVRRQDELLTFVGSTPLMTISGCPVPIPADVIDPQDQTVRNLLENPGLVSPSLGRQIDCGRPQPTLNGLSADRNFRFGDDGQARGHYMEVYRNGYCEYGDSLVGSEAALPSLSIAWQVHAFVELLTAVYSSVGILGPVAIWVAFRNVTNFWLALPRGTVGAMFNDDWNNRWPKPSLVTPKLMAYDLPSEGNDVAKQLNDRLWNAFRYEKASVYNEQGDLKSL